MQMLSVGAFGVGLIVTGFFAIFTIFGFLIHDRLGHIIHRAWARTCLAVLGIRLQVKGLENVPKDRAVIFAPNHESLFDILVLGALPVRFKWISKQEVGKVPLVGQAMKIMGCFFVRRDRSGGDLNVMKTVEDGLRAGRSVVIFPEGTRTRTGELLPFKKGAFRTSQNSGAPLLPVAIFGTYPIAPPGELPSRWGHKVRVEFGSPFACPENADLSQLMDDFRGVLTSLLVRGRAT